MELICTWQVWQRRQTVMWSLQWGQEGSCSFRTHLHRKYRLAAKEMTTHNMCDLHFAALLVVHVLHCKRALYCDKARSRGKSLTSSTLPESPQHTSLVVTLSKRWSAPEGAEELFLELLACGSAPRRSIEHLSVAEQLTNVDDTVAAKVLEAGSSQGL